MRAFFFTVPALFLAFCSPSPAPIPQELHSMTAYSDEFSSPTVPVSPFNPKQIAAERAAASIQDGMTVGLGTGSTAAYAILALGQRVRDENLRLRGLATSQASADLARECHIPLLDWGSGVQFDVTIDGADEVDPQFHLIKGGGGALVREKLVAAATAREIIIVDAQKVKARLGARPVPCAIVPWAWPSTVARLERDFPCRAVLRRAEDGEPFVSDDALFVADLHFDALLAEPATLERALNATLGVAECGLFIGLCHHLIIGHPDGTLEEKTPAGF